MTGAPESRTIVDKAGQHVDIVPYNPSHFERVVRMYSTYPTEHRSHGLPPVMKDDLKAWLSRLEQDGEAFVALLDAKIVGHAAYTPMSANKPDFVVFVDPEYQNRGIGTALVCHVVRNLAASGFDGAVSYVDRDNEGAIHVYEKIGFEEIRRDPLIVKMHLDFSESLPDCDSELDNPSGE